MANTYLIIPNVNPLEFFEVGRAILPQYNTKFTESFMDQETQKPWRTAMGKYFQKWQTNDLISLQIMSNVAPLTLEVWNCKGQKKGFQVFTQKQRNRFFPELFIYEVNYALNALPAGRYQFKIVVGDTADPVKTLETDWVDIAERWPNTVLVEYKNSFYYAEAIFATGWTPSFRVEGWFKSKAPVSKDEIYEDQVLNERMIYSDPYKIYEFIIGPSTGCPDWTPEKLIWIMGCDEVFYDGAELTKAEGSKFTEFEEDQYAYRGWAIDLRLTNRRSSKLFNLDPLSGGLTEKKLLVALNVETEGFADTTIGAGSGVIQTIRVDVEE